ncbi:cytochrome P450 [Marinitenerispora sediminis]|uniref:Cytochrome P450 n=1 Tax=Marinitenerispora sediminis TaxID=1931232 RepID=A0A368SYX5_9ACTN|nr:cytochrome P450 [Marinitenerispora sediminis]RCV50187.1 cytochrome P450 [Marinitenerispora sediminis]RCV52264.1 cytochrome P450 [Marinitenerispora sediminis]RCV56893.1 cytochrome P450 [Marinitenerispora sediminis]
MPETRPVPLPYRRERSWPFAPAAELVRLRSEEPLSRIPMPIPADPDLRVWLATRYSDVRGIMADPRFSNAPGPDEPRTRTRSATPPSLLGVDPPEHTRLRRPLTREFTVRGVNAMRTRIEEIVADRLAAMERAGPPADLLRDFALPVPVLVICELLGVPYRDRGDFRRRSDTLLDHSLGQEERARAAEETAAYMRALVQRHRADPGPELLGRLVREHGAVLTDADLVGLGSLLLVGGHETTANMLALGTLLLLRSPDQLAVVRDDPDAVAPAVEELLRYLSIVHFGVIRRATEDVTVAGRLVRAGELVVCSLPSANRDRDLLPDQPDRLDVTRRPVPHVAFGHGVHQCVGQQLARAELRIALPALLRRFPDLRLDVPFERIRYRDHALVYGVVSLPVRW